MKNQLELIFTKECGFRSQKGSNILTLFLSFTHGSIIYRFWSWIWNGSVKTQYDHKPVHNRLKTSWQLLSLVKYLQRVGQRQGSSVCQYCLNIVCYISCLIRLLGNKWCNVYLSCVVRFLNIKKHMWVTK